MLLRWRVENVIRWLRWKKERLWGMPSTPRPVTWGKAHVVALDRRGCTREQRERLAVIEKELELYSRLSDYFPSVIPPGETQILLACNSLKERIDRVKFLRLNELSAQKDNARKERRREQRKERMGSANQGETYRLFRMRDMAHRMRQHADWTALRTAYLTPTPRLAIDCSFLPNLSPRGANLTALQMTYLIAKNRERTNPWTVSLIQFDQQHPSNQRLIQKHLHRILASPVDLLDNMIDPSSTVYLSPHATEEIYAVEANKTYIVGGIVDRVTEKGIPPDASLQAALHLGVPAVRLPLDRYVQWKSGTRFLTLVAVMGILQDVFDHGDWEMALDRNIPVRNIRTADEKNPIAREHHRRIRQQDSIIRQLIQREISQ